jgi:capsular exopolysaccharide synthesis family protein
MADLKRQMAELSSSLTPAHYRVKRLQAQINELEAVSTRERANIIKRIRNEYDVALRREKQLEADYNVQAAIVSDQSVKMIKYNILKRDVETNRQLYEATQIKGKEVGLASALRATNARVVDPATPSTRPFKPDLMRNSALGLACGLFFGVVLVFFRERTDPSIQAPSDLLPYVNTRDLGVIPSAKADRELRLTRKQRGPLSLNGPGGSVKSAGAGVELVTWTQKPSLMAESFRSTMASILFSFGHGSSPQVILLTSPGPKEGKSTVISNLGIALAEINRRVLLIDGDLRIPRLHSIFDQVNSWGLSDILHERTPVSEYPDETLFRKTEVPGLFILPSGPARANVSSLLYSARMNELLQRFRRDFEIILIDTAPVLKVPDARILARLADAVVLVFRAGNTSREAARAAARRFEEDGTPVLGSVLNHWDPKSTGYGYYGTYSAYRVDGATN